MSKGSSKSSATPTTGSADLETDPNDKYFGWYPTLKTTVRLLESLYLVLDSGPFNGLAREAIMACAQTLCAAARLIEKKVCVKLRLHYTIITNLLSFRVKLMANCF